MSQHDRYISPFSTRYASDEMQYIFSDDNKFRTWRPCGWLAQAEMKRGLSHYHPGWWPSWKLMWTTSSRRKSPSSGRSWCAMTSVSCVYAYGRQCPKAAGIIHPCHQLLCRRQHRHHRDASGASRAGAQAHIGVPQLTQSSPGIRICPAWQHPPPARPAHHRGCARYPVGQRAGDGPQRDRPPSQQPCSCRASKVPMARPGFLLWSCLGATPTRSAPWMLPSLRRWASTARPSSRCPADLQPQGGRLHLNASAVSVELHVKFATALRLLPTSREMEEAV